jgi:hypothetical protein
MGNRDGFISGDGAWATSKEARGTGGLIWEDEPYHNFTSRNE